MKSLLNNLMAYLTVLFTDVKERQEGQTMVEYALLLVFIALVALVGITLVGTELKNLFTDISNKL